MLPVVKTLVERCRENGGGPVVVALDLGRQTGFAIHHVDGRIASQSYAFEKGGHPGASFNALRLFLQRTHTASGPLDLIFYEKKNFIGTSVENARVAFGFETNMLSWAALNKVKVDSCAPDQLKKFIAGHGHAPKDEATKDKMNRKLQAKGKAPYAGPTVEEAVHALGFNPRDHNEADALALLTMALERHVGRKGRAA